MTPRTVRVLIVGEDEESCWLLRLALQQDSRLSVSGHAKSGRELSTLLSELSPHVAVLDMDSLSREMVAAISLARLSGIKSGFVGLTDSGIVDEHLLTQLGALVRKDTPLEELASVLFEHGVRRAEQAASSPSTTPLSVGRDALLPDASQNPAPEEADSLLSLYINDMERSHRELQERVNLVEFWLQGVEIDGQTPTPHSPDTAHGGFHGEGEGASSYTLSVDAFFNAQHRVSIGGVEGPLHPHSWRVNVKLRQDALGSDHFLLGFAEARQLLRGETTWLDGNILNNLPQFSAIPPTTENVAALLFRNIKAALKATPIAVDSVTLWETPTNSVVYSEN